MPDEPTSRTATLAFHKVESGFSYSVTNYSPRRFRNLLGALKAAGAVPRLTFDDAYESFLDHARLILSEFNLSATIFAPTGWLGKTNSWDYSSRLKPIRHLSGAQLRELADDGLNVQSHGHLHLDLTRLSDPELITELRRSKEELENVLGRPVTDICYPFGRHDARVESAAKTIGYSQAWSLNPYDNGSFTRGRWAVYSFDTPFSVCAKLNGGALARIEFAKARLTNQLSRAGRLAFWTKRTPA